MMKLHKKFRGWLYRRKSARLAVKGMRLVHELQEWGCEAYSCDQCRPYQIYQNCYIHDEIEKWNRKLLKLEEKYSDVSSNNLSPDSISIPEIKAKKSEEN